MSAAVATTAHQSVPDIHVVPSGILQRKCDCGQHTGGAKCPACKGKGVEAEEKAASGGTRDLGPGRPIDGQSRRFMESRFSRDFSAVRVHSDPAAQSSAGSLNARAYTTGSNIVFGRGEYAPQSFEGRHLLAHELTHVLQQRGRPGLQPKSELSTPGDPAEREADRVAETVMTGGGRIPAAFRVSDAAVQRACGPVDIGTPADCTPDASTFVAGHPLFKFVGECDDFSGTEEASLRAAAAALPASGPIIIHGYASVDGDPTFNENLSCARAVKAESVLTGAGIASGRITKLRHGPTPGPTAERRCVVIEAVSPSPGPVPTPGPAPGPTVVIFPVIFGSSINRVPPGVGTSVLVAVTGLPSGSSIAIDILGSGGANGTATVAPATITGTSVVTMTGGTQTTPGSANNLMIRASLGGATLSTSPGFTVAAHPRDFTVTFNSDVSTATHVGVRSNNAWTSDGSGGAADLTEVERSEQVDVLSRDDPPFGPRAGVGRTSGFIPGTASPTTDTHTIPRSAISTPFSLLFLGTSFTVVKEQLFIFNDRRTGVTNQVVPNSGFTITHSLRLNAARPGWDHRCVKTGAATTVGAFSATAGSGTATSLIHPI